VLQFVMALEPDAINVAVFAKKSYHILAMALISWPVSPSVFSCLSATFGLLL
jgi:hypothetical protein